MKEKNKQVSERFYNTVVELLQSMETYQLTEKQRQLCHILMTEIEAKAAAAARREKFTAYKTAEPGGERDAKRVDYLHEAGKSRSFRSEKEIRHKEPN